MLKPGDSMLASPTRLILLNKLVKAAKEAGLTLRSKRALVVLVALAAVAIKAKSKNLKSLTLSEEDVPIAQELAPGERRLLVEYKQRMIPVTVHDTSLELFKEHEQIFVPPAPSQAYKSQFLHELKALSKIAFPSLNSKVVYLLGMHMSLLALRTYLSLVVARLDGQIVRDMIAAKGREFLRGIVSWLLLAVPAALTNASIRYLEGMVATEMRTTFTRYMHDLYIGKNMEYYKLSSIDGEISDPDHYITSDVAKFCERCASIFSRLGKPAIDIIFFSAQLSKRLGLTASVGLFLNYGLTAFILKSIAPPFGKLAARETILESDYRNAQSHVIVNAEEIAFYDGAEFEKKVIRRKYRKLWTHVRRILRIKAGYSVIENLVLKYMWSASGFVFAAIPVFMPELSGAAKAAITGNLDQSTLENLRMGHFITDKRLMLSVADAGGRLMYSIRDLAELAGYTSRVYQLISALHRVRAESYPEYAVLLGVPKEELSLSLADVRGRVIVSENSIKFKNVPIIVPGLGHDLSPGECLSRPVSITISVGEHLLITGPNGCGKSSVARILAGLWPLFRGGITRPERAQISFLPQRPYFSNGALRDQVIYPHSHSDMIQHGSTDENLQSILETVGLGYLVGREGGWSTVKEWRDVLSGGEKQKLMFARILYTKPRFAVIDEGTSAVSQDVEGSLYDSCKKIGVTLVTISHRIALMKYHKCILKLGLGSDGSEWKFEKPDTEEGRLSVQDEIKVIKARLEKMPGLQSRRDTIVSQLSLN